MPDNTSNQPKGELLVLVRTVETAPVPIKTGGDRGPAGKALQAVTESASKYIRVDPDLLQAQLQDFVSHLQKVLGALPAEIAKFSLEEVELSAEITAEGSVAFLGTGGKLSGTGGLTFTFKKP